MNLRPIRKCVWLLFLPSSYFVLDLWNLRICVFLGCKESRNSPKYVWPLSPPHCFSCKKEIFWEIQVFKEYSPLRPEICPGIVLGPFVPLGQPDSHIRHHSLVGFPQYITLHLAVSKVPSVVLIQCGKLDYIWIFPNKNLSEEHLGLRLWKINTWLETVDRITSISIKENCYWFLVAADARKCSDLSGKSISATINSSLTISWHQQSTKTIKSCSGGLVDWGRLPRPDIWEFA